MKNSWIFAAAVSAVATLAASARAADPAPSLQPKLVVNTTTKTATTPLRIVRKSIPTLGAAALTSRQLPKSSIAELVQRGALPTKSVGTAVPSGPPGKNALLIILENGGVMKNLDPALTSALNHDITTVTCGDFEFELEQGQSIVELIASVTTQLLGNTVCLDPTKWRTTVFNPYDWLDDQSDDALEAAVTANNSLINTQSRYDRVVVMEDADAVPARVLAMIRQLAPEYVLDVHVLTHGTSEAFVGHNGAAFTDGNFFTPLATERAGGLPLYLRAVYQMNCRGGTLKDNWRRLGATTVNGTVGSAMNNMPHQYFHFMQKWLAGTGMSTASQDAFNDASFYSLPVYTMVGQGGLVSVSRLTAEGSSPNANVNSAR